MTIIRYQEVPGEPGYKGKRGIAWLEGGTVKARRCPCSKAMKLRGGGCEMVHFYDDGSITVYDFIDFSALGGGA